MEVVTPDTHSRIVGRCYPDLLPLVKTAGDPNTSGGELAYLGKHPAPEVKRALTGNPSAPEGVLGDIAREILDSQGNPEIKYARSMTRRLARNPATPEWVQSRLMDDTSSVPLIAANTRAHPHILLHLASNEPDEPVALLIASNPSTPPEALVILASRRGQVRSVIAGRHDTPAQTLMDIARWEDSRLVVTVERKRRYSEHPTHTHWETEYDIQDARAPLFGNPATPVDAFLLLARSPHLDLRRRMASAALPGEALKLLVEDEDVWVCLRLARNPACSQGSLLRLSLHPSLGVREAVAHRPDLSREILARMAEDTHPNIRHLVAGRSDLPASMRQLLLSDCRARDRRAARKSTLRS